MVEVNRFCLHVSHIDIEWCLLLFPTDKHTLNEKTRQTKQSNSFFSISLRMIDAIWLIMSHQN